MSNGLEKTESAPSVGIANLPQSSLTADNGRDGKLNIALVKKRLNSLQTRFARGNIDSPKRVNHR